MGEILRNDKEDKRNKKFTEVRIFTVPFAIEDFKENVSFTTINNSAKFSKKKLINQALGIHAQGNILEAEKFYKYCINQGFKDHRIFSNFGAICKDNGKLTDAELFTRKAIELKPDYADAHNNLGNILKDRGKLQEAEVSIRKAIKLRPDDSNAYYNLGNILRDLGKLKEAELAINKAIEIRPDDFDAHYNLGNILRDLGKLKEAELSTNKAIELNPDYAMAHNNLGNILKDLGKLKEAEISLRQAININPNFAIAYSNLGNILKDLGKLKEAELSTNKAVELNPDFAMAHNNLGNILRDLGKLKEAEISLKKAIKINPNFAIAYNNLGGIFKDLGKLKEAELCTRKAIKINPNFSIAYNNLGNILRDLGELKEAEISLRNSIKINPNFAMAHNNLGNILKDLGNYNEAIESYNKSIKLDGNLSSAKWGLISSKSNICDWSDQENQDIWLKTLGINGASVNPWNLFFLEDNPLAHLQRSRNFFKEFFLRKEHKIACINNKKIHVGYFSSDFREHPTMHLISSILKLHDKSKFRVYLYSFTPKEDEYTLEAMNSGCIYRNIKGLDDLEAAELARKDNLNIAIDLMGYIQYNRMAIFSYRVAPIQINYLGFPGSVGADTIDYILADNILIPKDNEKFYSEKILRMPNCYQCNDNKKDISKENFSRKDFNLPDKGFVFTCFNNNYKITPKEFDIWMKLLKKVEGSVLWLYKSNEFSKKNLCKEALERKVDPERLIFANRLQLDKHLARHSLGDLAIDTFNCNGHTTTSDALWAGLPVLTRIGESFAARVSASLLSYIGLPELISYTEEEYEVKALHIANNPDELIRLKANLANLRETSTLYNSELFTRNLEDKLKELLKINHSNSR